MRPFELSRDDVRNTWPPCGPAGCSVSWLSVLAVAAEAPSGAPVAEDVAFFETKIRPLLVKHCLECHGAETQEGKLGLDTFAGLMKGGSSGPAVQPGKVDESLLWVAVSYRNEDLQMPPDGKLPEQELEYLRRWLSKGAAHPDAGGGVPVAPVSRIDLEEGRKFWAFQPPQPPPPPTVRATEWPRTPVDHFILAALEARSLEPSRPADKRTLLRRVTFDLIGLPPTPAELDAFLADDSPEAFARVVDRLLASPHTANAGAGTGSTSPATPTRTDWTRTSPTATRGDIATTSSGRSTPTSHSTDSSWSKSPATCCRRRGRSASHEQLIATGFPVTRPEGVGRSR